MEHLFSQGLSVRKDANESRPEKATAKTVEKESLGNEVENNDKVNVKEYAQNNVTINNNLVTTTMSFLPCVNDDVKVKEAVDN